MALLTSEQRVLTRVLNGAVPVWTGRPLPGFRLRSGDAGQLAMGAFAIAFVVLWETMAIRSGAPGLFPIFGAVMFCVFFYQTFGRVIASVAARGRTYYALTQDGFAFMYVEGFGGHTKSVYLPALNAIDLQTSADGSGSIVFGSVEAPPWWARNRGWSAPRPPAFEAIADAANVYDICKRLQAGRA